MKIKSINKRYTKDYANIAFNIKSAVTNDVINSLYEKMSRSNLELKKHFKLSIVENEETILQIEKLPDNKVEINSFIIEQINSKLSEIASEREKLLEEISKTVGVPLEEIEG